ncbi:T-cell surface antigen CD2-like [Motacilla alba alba]|uniref:T-cell surface antigen CD2-like n=1 Tax=Motacilla alba alba TaxID=1094192 RepID=UPI0018D53980|nr:T-cell surface antigen CD2-like [Motacilla alba alba]
MNFRRIFLIKCLLLLFPSVKCSSTSWIYKAVNETALLGITVPGSIYEATWWRGGQRLVQVKDNKTKHFANKEQCRCAILRNGTLQIQRVEKEDSGNYMVMVYQQDGKLKAEENIMFFVQEPVPQPILIAECRNKSVSVKCEAKQKAKDEVFTIQLTQPNGKKIQKNATMLEWHGWNSGTFRCVAKNQVSEKMAEKVINCSGKMDFYLILSIAGGAVFFVIFVICLIYCIRRKKTKRNEIYDEERAMQTLPMDREREMRELPPAPSKPTPKQLRVQQRPLPPQPQEPQQPRPQPRPRAQPRTPNPPRQRP